MNQHKLLIVDDDELVGETISRVAAQCQFDVIYTDSAMNFFEQLALFQPDIIVVDLILPNIDGLQLIHKLAEINSRAKLVIVSGAGRRVLNSAALSAQEHGLGILGILNKPFRNGDLRQLLSSFQAYANNPIAFETQETPALADVWFATPEDLREALENNDIRIALQPQVDSISGLVIGFETLARWEHPEHGMVRPDYFVQLAERTHLIDELTDSVIKQSFAWFAGLKEVLGEPDGMTLHAEMDNLRLSVNLSAISLLQQHLPDELKAQCERFGLAPHQIVFEITESAAMDDPTQVLDILTRLRILGFGLSIDDFGTGYSSLAQLARLPFSELKVDQSFVMTAADSKESQAVISTVVQLAKSLALTSVAEGVETEAQRSILQAAGCEQLQGYLIARPMTPPNATDWLLNYYNDKEKRRLAALNSLAILDSDEEARFDRITHLAKRLFQVETVLLSLVTQDRQWFKSAIGMNVPETPRAQSLCAHAIGFRDIYEVNNAAEHPRFANNPLVTKPNGIRFYAGCPIQEPTGERLGTLCLIDPLPRGLSELEKQVLRELASLVEDEFVANISNDIDKKTSVFNRTAFEPRARAIMRLAASGKFSVTMLLIDINNFSAFNNEYGSEIGDQVLIALARIINKNFRRSDMVGRFAGDKFIVLLVNDGEFECSLDQQQAVRVRLNRDINNHLNPTFATGQQQLSVSMGFSDADQAHNESFYDLLYQAEHALNQERYKRR